MKGFLGGMMLATGILIAGLSGLCTGVVLIGGLVGGGGEEFASIAPLALVFGGVPFAIGLGLFFGGRSLLRGAQSPKVDPADFE
ncbi:MAG: hypothetical protein J7496_02095 [Novosphingobium sp.]|nr:hypothetical protein [Novosphingobium sp.]MBO9601279.1 hypothetical protein [Novosphingobium sp.]